MRESKYLRVRTGPRRARAGSAAKILQDTVDGSYAVLLRSLDYVFQQGDQQRGAMLEAARRAMYNIDDACRSLSEQGFGGLFNLPRMATAKAGSVKTPRDIGQPLRRHLTSLRKSKHPDLRALADRMDGKLAELTESIATTVRQTKP
jgi:hypothetical protein